MASKIGYISSNIGKDIINKNKYLNIYGEDPSRINRTGTSLYWDGITNCQSKIKYKNGFYLVLFLNNYNEHKIIQVTNKIILNSVRVLTKFF